MPSAYNAPAWAATSATDDGVVLAVCCASPSIFGAGSVPVVVIDHPLGLQENRSPSGRCVDVHPPRGESVPQGARTKMKSPSHFIMNASRENACAGHEPPGRVQVG